MRVACVAVALAMLLGCSKDGAVAESLPSTSTSSSNEAAGPAAVRTAPRTYTPRRNAKRGLNPRRSSKGSDSRAQLLSFFANADGTPRVNTYEAKFWREGKLTLEQEQVWVYEVDGHVTTADAYWPDEATKAEWQRFMRIKDRIETDRALRLQKFQYWRKPETRDRSPTVPFVVAHWPLAKGDRREATYTLKDGQVVHRIRTVLEVGLRREVNGRVFVGCVREEVKRRADADGKGGVGFDGGLEQYVNCPGVGVIRWEQWNSSGQKTIESKLKKTGSVIPPEIKALRPRGSSKGYGFRGMLLTKDQKQQVQDAIQHTDPKLEIAVNARFADRVRLASLQFDKRAVKPGESFNITYAWEVLEDLNDTDWKIAVHIDGKKRYGRDHHGVGGLYPMRKWPKGKFVKYSQKIKIPADAKPVNASIFIGIFDEAAHRGGQKVRLEISNGKELKFRRDRDGRLEIGRIEITGKKGQWANKERPKYAIYRAASPLNIDGLLTEPAWRQARLTRAFLSREGHPMKKNQETRAKMAWDDTYFYAAFISTDSDLFSSFKGRDSTLWKQDVINIYLDPGVTHSDYVDIQIAPTKEIFDAHFSKRRRPWNGPKGKEWLPAAQRLTLSGMKIGVKTDGSLNKRGDGVQDKKWTLEVAIPWTELPTVTGPPKDGEAWGVNFYRINASGPGSPYFDSAWSPAGNDFHNTNRFGTVRFSSKVSRSVRSPGR